MVIWRGYGGAVAAIVLILGVLLGMWLSTTFSDGGASYLLIGVGMLIAAVPVWLLGRLINVPLSQEKLPEWVGKQRATLEKWAAEGTLQKMSGLDEDAPDSEHVEHTLQNNIAARQTSNKHTVFLMPVQWFAIVYAVFAVVMVVAGFTQQG